MWTLARYRLRSGLELDIDRLLEWIWQIGARGTETRDQETFAEFDSSAFDRRSGDSVEVIGYFPPEEDPRSKPLPAPLEDLVVDVAFEALDPDAWTDGWRQFFSATQVSPRVMVYPSWDPPATAPSGVTVQLDPGMAFGTGTHETTRLCVRILDRVLMQTPGATVLDVGSGSGVLSICAAKLGANSVRGIDIDPIAVDVAKENWQANGLDAAVAPFSSVALSELKERYDLVIANMLSSILRSLRYDLWRALARTGTLVLSGILDTEESTFLDAFLTCDHALVRRHQEAQWIALELKHK